MTEDKTEHLTDEEREAIEDEAQSVTPDVDGDDTGEAEDRPWLNQARDEMRKFLTDEELAALSDGGDESQADDDGADDAADADDGLQSDDDVQQQDDAAQAAKEEPEASGQDPELKLTKDEIDEIKAKAQEDLDALDDLYDDGDLTREELRARRREILNSQDEEIAARLEAKANDAARQREEAFVESHRAAARDFFAKNAALAQDKTLLARFDVLQQQVQMDPKWQGTSSAGILEEAKQRLVDEARREGKTIPGLTAATKRPSHATRDIPPSVRSIPAAAPNRPEGSELAQIANQILNADPIRAETLMARLTPEQQDRILQGDY